MILGADRLLPRERNPRRSRLSLASGVSGRMKGGKGETWEESRLPAEAHGPTPYITLGRLLEGPKSAPYTRKAQPAPAEGGCQPSLPLPSPPEETAPSVPGIPVVQSNSTSQWCLWEEQGICLCTEFMSLCVLKSNSTFQAISKPFL